MREDLLTSHFVDNAILKKCISTNSYNERVFDTPITINCRKVYKTRVIKTPNNEDVVSTITLYTFNKINQLDNIDDKDVLEIHEWKSLFDNTVVGYKVYL